MSKVKDEAPTGHALTEAHRLAQRAIDRWEAGADPEAVKNLAVAARLHLDTAIERLT
jgi:hypothetical protein